MRKLAIAPLVAAAVLVLVLGTCFHQYGEIDAPAAKGGSDLVRLSDGAGGAKASRVAYNADDGQNGRFEINDKITVVISNTGNGTDTAVPYTFESDGARNFTPDDGVPQYWNDFGGRFDAYAYYPAGAEYVDLRDQSTWDKHVEAGYLFAEKQTGINKGNYNNDKKFTFKHKTARVKVTLRNEAGSSAAANSSTVVTFYGYTIGMPDPDDPDEPGKITPIASVPSGDASPVTATTPNGEITPYKSGNTYTAMMIPAEYTNPDGSGDTFLKVVQDGEIYNYKPASLSLEAGKTYTLNVTVKDMVSLPGGTITGGVGGAFPTGRTVTLSPFHIAKYETTYELWKEVYDWAVLPANGYTFANPGWEGHEAAGTSPGTGTTNTTNGWTAEEKKTRPVTYVSWRDVIVWCNAYSEKRNLQPVYYTGSSSGIVIKDSTNTACDNAYMDRTKNGYRLPTEAEWEYAARGGDTGVADWNYQWAGTNDDVSLGGYAWYTANSSNLGSNHRDYGTHPVGTTTYGNSAGLYDMSGNVFEWVWDWRGTIAAETVDNPVGASSGTDRLSCGGSWRHTAAGARSVNRAFLSPSSRYNDCGFRLVRP